MTCPDAIKIGVAVLLLFSSNPRLAFGKEDTVFKSGNKHVSLLELYTSEGCSSCPPAESWFNTLRDNPLLWKGFVPVAFHVDYWNYLGWADPYSSKDYSDRQRDYGDFWRASSIYTPEFFLDGKEWRLGSMDILGQLEKNSGSLKATIRDDGKVEILYNTPIRPASSFVVEVALLAGGISEAVTSGENAGKTLHHDFLALCLLKSELGVSSQGTYNAEITLPNHKSKPAQAIAIWVHTKQSLIPIQAVGGWLHTISEIEISRGFK